MIPELKQKENDLKVTDGRAALQRRKADKNIERVVEWYSENEDGERMECSKALNLSYRTVCRIITGLQEGE